MRYLEEDLINETLIDYFLIKYQVSEPPCWSNFSGPTHIAWENGFDATQEWLTHTQLRNVTRPDMIIIDDTQSDINKEMVGRTNNIEYVSRFGDIGTDSLRNISRGLI